MGVSYSNSLKHFQNEVDSKFLRPLEHSVESQRLLAGRPFEERARRVLFTYPSLLLLSFMDGMSIDLGHLAVLFVLDGDGDGLFSWGDIEAFIEWVHNTIPTDEKELGGAFGEAVHARCVLQMWRECTGIRGQGDSGHSSKRMVARPSESQEVGSMMSSPANDPANSTNRRNSAASQSTMMYGNNGEAGGGSGSSSKEAGESDEIFEVWFERFLSRNFPFLADRQRQRTPLPVSTGSPSDQGPSSSSSMYDSLVVDADGTDAIAVSEVAALELRQRPRSLSLDAIAAAHVLLGVEENDGMDLKQFCVTLVGEENLRHMRNEFACPARALRAFNTAFIDSYWTVLRRFDLQVLL